MRDLSVGFESKLEPRLAEKMERLTREVERLRVVTSEDSQDLPEAILQHSLHGVIVKFTPSGPSIRVDSYLQGDTAAITVSDAGPGIDADHLPRIFERYYQAPSGERRGVGLALFIAKAIVSAQGGRIGAESMPGVGSKFCFTLPLDEGKAP